MDFSNLLPALNAVLQPAPLLGLLLGVLIGSLTGVLPGLGAVGAMAVLMPFSIALDPIAGILMLAGIYIGAQYGGSTTAILMRIPGESSSVITSFDGYAMTQRGRAGVALAISAIGSFIAGTLAVAGLMLLGPTLANVALNFSSPEFLALAFIALLVLSRITGDSFWLSFASALLGVVFATVGLNVISAVPRFTFGIQEFALGIHVTPLAVGLFGLVEIFLQLEGSEKPPRVHGVKLKELLPSRTDLRRSIAPIFRGGSVGFVFGLIPGPAAVMSTYASYTFERRVSKRKEEFGKGAVEGVAGPEAANNAASGSAMVPLLILGIPFAAPTAILLGALTLHGLSPGPALISQNPVFFWSIVLGLYFANAVLLVLNLPLIRLFTYILRTPSDILMGGVLLVTIIGTYAIRNSFFDVYVLLFMGVLGYLFAKAGIPRAPIILGFVMGGVLERSFAQTMALSGGNLAYLLNRPIVVGLGVVGILVFVLPPAVKRAARARADGRESVKRSAE